MDNGFNLNIPLKEMEQLENKYGIELFIEQYDDPDTPDSYWEILKPSNVKLYLGHTIGEVERVLKRKYGK